MNILISSAKQFLQLSWFKCHFFLLVITYHQPASGKLIINSNTNHSEISRFIESSYCSGYWCKYVQQCIEKDSQFKNDNYMNGICTLLITELNDVLVKNPFLNFAYSQRTAKEKLFSIKKNK